MRKSIILLTTVAAVLGAQVSSAAVPVPTVGMNMLADVSTPPAIAVKGPGPVVHGPSVRRPGPLLGLLATLGLLALIVAP